MELEKGRNTTAYCLGARSQPLQNLHSSLPTGAWASLSASIQSVLMMYTEIVVVGLRVVDSSDLQESDG